MPLPTPSKNEKRSDFISRCMGDDVMNKEYPGQDQRAAVCNTQWGKKDLKSDWIDKITLSDNVDIKREIMLFPYGDFEHPTYGKLKFNDEFFNEIITNYKKNVLGTKPFIDRQHEEDEALAWIDTEPFTRPGLGLYMRPEWTALGEKMLKEKLYRYLSPSWGKYKDPQTGKTFENVLYGAAATNIPFLKMMPAIIDDKSKGSHREAAIMRLSDLIVSDSLEAGGVTDEGEKRTSEKIKTTNKGGKMEKLVKIFNLSEDATEDSILAKIQELIDENKKIKDELKQKQETNDVALTEQLENVKKKLADTHLKLITRECETIVGKALSEGKIKPADKEHWSKRYMSDPDNVKKDLEIMSPVVDFSEKGSSGEGSKKTLTDDPGKQLSDEAYKLVSENKAKNFTEAVAKISAENPALARAYVDKYKA